MPTIGELIQARMDSTGASYGDLSRKANHALGVQHLQKLVTQPIKEFPKPRTVELLADLLELPATTIVLSFAAALGLPVSQAGPALANALPPGTDVLTGEDRDAVRVLLRQLVDARQRAGGKLVDLARPPQPDLSRVAARHGESVGRRLRQEQDEHGEQ